MTSPPRNSIIGTGRLVVGLCFLGAFAAAAGCSGTSGTASGPASGPSVSARSTTPAGVSSSAAVEVNPPGDIPDNQAFVPFTARGYHVSVPEGWARRATTGGVVFSDKYNSVTVTGAARASAPTPAGARAHELPAIRSASVRFVPGRVGVVRRTAGPAVLITYHAQSAVNPVTGKVAQQAVERYEFWRAGRAVVITVAAPDGSDNVDPWRTVTDSFAWTSR